VIDRIFAVTNSIARYSTVIAGVCLMSIVAVTTLNIIARRFFMSPILGAHEAVEYLGALLISLTLAYNQINKENIRFELMDVLFSARTRVAMESVTSFICAILCLLIAWQCSVYALGLWEAKEVSLTMGIPFFPVIFVVAASFVLLALVLFVESMKAFAEMRK